MLRDGAGFVPKPDTVIEAGDEVLLVLDPGLEDAITAYFTPNGQPATFWAETRWAVGYPLGHTLSGMV